MIRERRKGIYLIYYTIFLDFSHNFLDMIMYYDKMRRHGYDFFQNPQPMKIYLFFLWDSFF